MSKTLTLAGECALIAERLILALAERGHVATRSFDLQSARTLLPDECECPHHHTTHCTCQYLVLIVYPSTGSAPRSVVLHEFERRTRITLDDPDGLLTAALMEATCPAERAGNPQPCSGF